MAEFGWGNQSYHSTDLGLSANPTTSALLAEIDSTVIDGFVGAQGAMVQATWWAGASTNANFVLEQALSTGLGSTAIVAQIVAQTPTAQTPQYISRHLVSRGDRFRVHLLSSFTGNAAAHIQLEPLI